MSEAASSPVDLYEEYFDDEKFDTLTLDDIGDIALSSTDTVEDWTFVRARAMTRDCMLYSEGIYKVLSTKQDRPLADRLKQRGHDDMVADGRVQASTDDVLQAMPTSEKQQMAVPSIRGEYLRLKEVRGRETTDGTIEVETTAGFSDTIPVEFVIEPLSYDEVVCELLDDTLGD